MVSDETYDLCRPVLEDATLEEEDKIDRLETLLKSNTSLQGQALENAVLDAVWRFRQGGSSATSPPPIRQTILRRPSPASWRSPPGMGGGASTGGLGSGYHSSAHTPLSGSPRLGISPLAPPGYVPPSLANTSAGAGSNLGSGLGSGLSSTSLAFAVRAVSKSAAASPFSSPRPSPRLAFASPALPPAIPHSPSLNAYEFASDPTPAAEIFGDAQQTDNVDWIVSDDAASATSSLSGAPTGTLSSTAGFGTLSGTSTPTSSSGLNAAAPEFSLSSLSSQQADMTPYDMLRSILGPQRTDDEIDAALATHGYDLGATIVAIMELQQQEHEQQKRQQEQDSSFRERDPDDSVFCSTENAAPTFNTAGSIGSSVDETSGGGVLLVSKTRTPDVRPTTPVGETKSSILCKFFLSTGQCLRADCRFSHDLNNHICKYWIAGNCLAGSTCVFSHDPTTLMNRLAIDGNSTPPPQQHGAPLALHDYNAFPTLHQPQPGTPEQLPLLQSGSGNYRTVGLTPPPGFKLPNFGNDVAMRPRSRPGSRHQMRLRDSSQTAPSIDDTDAFPSLSAMRSASGASSASVVGGKKHHGKRGGHGHHREGTSSSGIGSGLASPMGASSTATTSGGVYAPSSLADIVKMSPSPGPETPPRPGSRKQQIRNGSGTVINTRGDGASSAARATMSGNSGGENSAAAHAIPMPKHIPWLETGDYVNRAYLKARQEAIKHGGLRNKFLQSAAQAWNRNDARAAKALSLRGQSENDLMRKAHREAARELYEGRNAGYSATGVSPEIYIDLHGLHPEEAVEYLERVLLEHEREARPVYAITGTGNHSKNGKDKVGKAVRHFLNEWRYAYREFSVPGDRNNMGGILGIDARSYDKTLLREMDDGDGGGDSDVTGRMGKITFINAAGGEGGASSTPRAVPGTTMDLLAQGVEIGEGKVKMLVRDPAAKEAAAKEATVKGRGR